MALRVLMFGWEFPPHISGGLGTACYGMTRGLLKQNVEVLFVVPKAYGDEDQRAVRIVNASDIPVEVTEVDFNHFSRQLTYLEVASLLKPYLTPEAYEKIRQETRTETEEKRRTIFGQKYEFSGGYGKNLMDEVARYALVAATVASRYDFDVIHAHDWFTYHAGIAAKKVSGKPLVVHIHATEFDRTGQNVNTIIYDIEKSGMEAADRVIAVSNFTRNTVIEKYGIDPAKVVTVHNAIDPVEADPELLNIKKAVKEKVVTFLGRITFQKGPEYFVEAARKVLDRDRNVRFVMAGSGDMLNKVIRRVAQLKMADRFHFTGFLRGKDVNRMFALSDLFVMPSVSEPFGLVPLEAMRTNVPVIVSKQSGVAEVLRHAIKVDYWDVEGLADAMWGLLHYNSLASVFAKHGKAEVDALKWDAAAEKIVDVYRQVLKQP
ncbi:MAG: glycosyltransferase family 4 protein [Bacteroidales bacterium]